MTSKLVGVKSEPGRVTFIVEHLPTDSYSRSVRREARRALRASPGILRSARWAGRGSIYEGDWVFDLEGAPAGKSWTGVPFTFDTVPEPR